MGSDRGAQNFADAAAKLAVAWVLLVFAASSAAQSAYRPQDPYAGVVSNSTITFIGQEFYREFVAGWRDQPQSEQFSVSIHERPSARWGSLIWVESANRQLFRAYLSPGRRDLVRLAARDAMQIVYQGVIDAEVQRLMFRDPDLARDEF